MTFCCRTVWLGCLFWVLSACATGPDSEDDPFCSRAICGCWENHLLHATVSVVDDVGRAAFGITLLCDDPVETFGTTDTSGILRLVAAGRTSPGCGYIADCELASLADQHGNTLDTFALTPLLRGETLIVGKLTLSAAPSESHRD